MIQECGTVNWFKDEDGTVWFYLVKEQQRLNAEQLKEWMDCISAPHG